MNKKGKDNTFINNQNKDDYFFSIYKNVASKNIIIRNLTNLNDKVNKASSKPVSVNGIYGYTNKENINLKNFTIKTNLNNPSNKISFLEKIEKEKNNILDNNNEIKNSEQLKKIKSTLEPNLKYMFNFSYEGFLNKESETESKRSINEK